MNPKYYSFFGNHDAVKTGRFQVVKKFNSLDDAIEHGKSLFKKWRDPFLDDVEYVWIRDAIKSNRVALIWDDINSDEYDFTVIKMEDFPILRVESKSRSKEFNICFSDGGSHLARS